MTTTVVGQLVTRDGANCTSYFSPLPEHLWNPIRHRTWVVPATEVRSVQASEIPLRLDHGAPAVGRITHLERRAADQSIWCVGEIAEFRPPADLDLYLSVEAVFDEGTIGRDVEIRGAALCEKSAMIGLHPCTILNSGLDQRGQAQWRLGKFQQSLLEKAARYRRPSEPLLVHEELSLPTGSAMDSLTRSSLGAIEYRSATQLAVTGRTIELIVMPYEREAVVEHQGRIVREVVSRGAFDGLEERPGRVRLNRDHDRQRTVGKALSFDTTDPRGLLAEVQVSNTELGRETLELARDGVLDCSAGFAVREGGESWPAANLRRLTRLWLDHIALTPDPAYADARVLAVRDDRLALR